MNEPMKCVLFLLSYIIPYPNENIQIFKMMVKFPLQYFHDSSIISYLIPFVQHFALHLSKDNVPPCIKENAIHLPAIKLLVHEIQSQLWQNRSVHLSHMHSCLPKKKTM